MDKQIELMAALIIEQKQNVLTIDRKHDEESHKYYIEQSDKLEIMEEILESLYRLKDLEK